jgi:capsule biosynthesis phosphatase
VKRLIVDLDDTLTVSDPSRSYADKEPNLPLVEKLRQYKSDGFEIIIHTARNMRTHDGRIGRINVHTLPGVLDWLTRHQVPFDEVHVGKPWCGPEGFYIDDRAIRPSEFVSLSRQEIDALIRPVTGQ